MAISRKKKTELKATAVENFSQSSAYILAGYKGLTMAELSELRAELRGCGTKFAVVKNNIVKKAIETDCQDGAPLSEELKGPIGIAFISKESGDPAQAAKTLFKFQKTHPALEIKCGIVDSKLAGSEDLKAISELPSREELLAKIVGSIASPARGLVTVLSGVPRNLVQVINAIKEKKSA